MADAYDPVPDLARLLDAALVFNGTDAYGAACRLARYLGISEDDRDGAAERALRDALGITTPRKREGSSSGMG